MRFAASDLGPLFAPREVTPPVHRGHVPMAKTSLAARKVRQARGLKPQQVDVMRVLSRGPSTSDEIVSATGLPANVVAPRLQELRKAGWIDRLADKRPTRSGVSAFVHAITATGRAELQRVGGAA